jgi:DNA processing protein
LSNSELRERLIDTIALLNIPGIGVARCNRLIKAFGTPAAVLSAPVHELETVPGISHNIAVAIKTGHNGEKARQIAARIFQLGWAVLFPDQQDFPSVLRHIPNCPPLLFRLGERLHDDDKLIAIVGTRNCTEKGRLFAYNLAKSLSQRGIIVVSGMAEGIDAAAHAGALDANGKTIAVWGSSLDIVYPSTNRSMAERIKKHGAVYSEYLPGTEPDRATFPERNRIISGMSEGVVVVEAGTKSGALITARLAVEQGRELFAVPGPPDAKMSQGTNDLIKNGARLLTRPEDIFDELPRLKGEIAVKKYNQMPQLTDTEKRIVALFSSGSMQVDQIARVSDMPVATVMQFLLALELKGVVKELAGKRFILSEDFV